MLLDKKSATSATLFDHRRFPLESLLPRLKRDLGISNVLEDFWFNFLKNKKIQDVSSETLIVAPLVGSLNA